MAYSISGQPFIGTEDDLIFDICELETLAERIAQTLQGMDPSTLPPSLPAGRLMYLLIRAGDASVVIQQSVGKTVADVSVGSSKVA